MAVVLPSPNPVYRGPLKFMDGAPTPNELLVMGALLLVGLLLLLLAWSLISSYVRGRWDGWMDPSPWQPMWALLAATAGLTSLVVLWLQFEHIAARMGVTVIVLGALLAAETRAGAAAPGDAETLRLDSARHGDERTRPGAIKHGCGTQGLAVRWERSVQRQFKRSRPPRSDPRLAVGSRLMRNAHEGPGCPAAGDVSVQDRFSCYRRT